MRVSVRLYGQLRKHHPGSNRSAPLDLELPEDATVQVLVEHLSGGLNFPTALAKSALVNNKAAPLTTVLEDGDQVGLFPPVAGG